MDRDDVNKTARIRAERTDPQPQLRAARRRTLITGGLIDPLWPISACSSRIRDIYIPDTIYVANLDTLNQMVDRVMQDAS